MNFSTLHARLHLLSGLRNLWNTSLIRTYDTVLGAQTIQEFSDAYGALCATLYQEGDAGDLLFHEIACDENALTSALSSPSKEVLHGIHLDLQTLSALLSLHTSDFIQHFEKSFPEYSSFVSFLPQFPTCKPLPFTTADELSAYYKQHGFGFFAKASSFTVQENGEICPVIHPDCIQISDLKGYVRQREQVIANTLSFLERKPANNILLYGDKGTGKSSTVKAVAHEYAHKGLKIVELSPRQIHIFPKLCALAANSPYRIIVFMDDLCFDHEDNNFGILKAFIEGGLTGKPENLVVYATSNRRHLVRETFSERQGDDIHVRDTLETITSLSDRFGLEITFSVPDKEEYLYIVDQLAQNYGLQLPTEQLYLLAERFALRRNGRSPRTAQQFIRYLLTQQENATKSQGLS